ncbi:hypothetical protein PAXRUDRAFT_827100 [Paxillus rubicundulus Ve08.2h10]|uniref:Uncharacterized protein n=1 Tax=Paxillus rubicundulus Ve08.2h10 TaxID=930991 RepID=A0A0D0DDJ6_9AGAM|nr:hypothetical protein PAXRUDRAFT_827100 [Paxillus rubicundulus Ve08.2h10]
MASLVESEFPAAATEERKRRVREEAFQRAQKSDDESSSGTWRPRRPTRRNAMWPGCKATDNGAGRPRRGEIFAVLQSRETKTQNRGVQEMRLRGTVVRIMIHGALTPRLRFPGLGVIYYEHVTFGVPPKVI